MKYKMKRNIPLEKFTKDDFADYFKLVSNEKVMEMITERAIGAEEAQIHCFREHQ